MRDPKILADTLSLLNSLMGDILEASEESPSAWGFGKLEVEIWTALMKVGAFVLAQICGARTGDQGKSVPGHRDIGQGTHRLKFKGLKKRWVTSVFGRIFYWRAYYRHAKLVDSRWPRDEELGLVPKELLSPGVQQKVALLSVVTESYDQAAATLKEFLPVDLQYKQAQRECLKLGAEMEAAVQSQVQKVFEERQQLPDPAIGAPDALLVGCDGITVPHCAGEDMEIKVARMEPVALQLPPAKPDRKRVVKPRGGAKKRRKEDPQRQEELTDLKESREQREYKDASKLVEASVREVAPGRNQASMYRRTTETSTYVATSRLGVENFGRCMWLAAQQLGVELTALILFVADGGRWCWEICETQFSNAVQILDIFHVARHVIEAANVLWGTRSLEAKRWRKMILVKILRCEVEDVIRELTGLSFVEEAKREARKSLLVDLVNNRTRMDYPSHIQKGYPISSAMAEGACRHVIGTRMKGSGRRWDDDGGDAMARLRALKCSGQWHNHFERRQEARRLAMQELRRAA
jgi:hypothetical protein